MSGDPKPGWVKATLGDLTAVRVGQGVPGDAPVPYIDIGSVDRSTKTIGETESVTATTAPTRARQWVRDGDVLVSMTRPNLNAVALIQREHDGAVASTGFDVLRPVGVLPEWLFYRVRSNVFIGDVCEDLQGVVYPAIRPHDVRKHELPVAPLSEQRRIVEAIESYLTRLDDVTATLDRVQQNLKRYRASVLQAAVEGRLVPTEAELARAEGRDYEPASVLLERILAERRRRWEEAELAKMKAKGKLPKDDRWKKKYKEPVSPSTAGLPELPEGWCWASMDQLTRRVTSGSRDWTKYYGRGDSVFVMAQNVRPQHLDLEHRQAVDPPLNDPSRERSQILMHDLLVTIVGANTGNVCCVPDDLPQHYVCQSVALMRPVEQLTSPYLESYLNSRRGQQVYAGFMYGQGRPHLSFDNLKETPVPLPPRAEQLRIIATLEPAQTAGVAIARDVRNEATRCSRLRQSILKWAFEGKLVDQDPTDEPASALLDRIKAEHAAAGNGARTNGRARPARRRPAAKRRRS